jgi:hypothetical protein
VPRLRAAKFTSRAGVGSRRAYSAGTPDLGEDDFEALPTGGLRRGPRQLVRRGRAFRIATVADSFSESRARRAGAPEGLRAAPVCFPENPTVCYRPMPHRYGLGARDYGVGGGNRNDRKSSTDCARLAAGWRTDVR